MFGEDLVVVGGFIRCLVVKTSGDPVHVLVVAVISPRHQFSLIPYDPILSHLVKEMSLRIILGLT